MSSASNDDRRRSLTILGVLVGLLLVGLGAWFVQPDSRPTFGPIECDGDVMGPGDKCIVIRGGGEDFTYESEQAERQARIASWRDEPGDEIVGWAFIGIGVLSGVGGTVAGTRRRAGADVAQVPAVAPEVWAAASEHRLGDHVRTQRSEASDLWFAVGGAVVCGAVTFALVVGPAASGSWLGLLALLSGLATLGCLGAALRRLFVVGSALYLFEHGLVHTKGEGTTVFPWRDTEVRRSVVKQQNAPRPDYRYWLQRPGVPTVQLSPTLQLDEFGPDMEQRLTAERAPADLESVAAGQRVRYGPFAVDLTGLTTPKGTIAWPQVRAVEAKQGAVQVWQLDARKPQSVDVSKVPNVFVFLAIVEAVRGAVRPG